MVVALMLALGALLAQRLEAQSRGSLQVAARVVTTAPSQLALATGLAAVGLRSAPVTQSLASVRVAPEVREVPRERRIRRPRTVLTISFLRN